MSRRFTRVVVGYERPRTVGHVAARKRLAAIRIASRTYEHETLIARMFDVPYWLVVPGRVPRHPMDREPIASPPRCVPEWEQERGMTMPEWRARLRRLHVAPSLIEAITVVEGWRAPFAEGIDEDQIAAWFEALDVDFAQFPVDERNDYRAEAARFFGFATYTDLRREMYEETL